MNAFKAGLRTNLGLYATQRHKLYPRVPLRLRTARELEQLPVRRRHATVSGPHC